MTSFGSFIGSFMARKTSASKSRRALYCCCDDVVMVFIAINAVSPLQHYQSASLLLVDTHNKFLILWISSPAASAPPIATMLMVMRSSRKSIAFLKASSQIRRTDSVPFSIARQKTMRRCTILHKQQQQPLYTSLLAYVLDDVDLLFEGRIVRNNISGIGYTVDDRYWIYHQCNNAY